MCSLQPNKTSAFSQITKTFNFILTRRKHFWVYVHLGQNQIKFANMYIDINRNNNSTCFCMLYLKYAILCVIINRTLFFKHMNSFISHAAMLEQLPL